MWSSHSERPIFQVTANCLHTSQVWDVSMGVEKEKHSLFSVTTSYANCAAFFLGQKKKIKLVQLSLMFTPSIRIWLSACQMFLLSTSYSSFSSVCFNDFYVKMRWGISHWLSVSKLAALWEIFFTCLVLCIGIAPLLSHPTGLHKKVH